MTQNDKIFTCVMLIFSITIYHDTGVKGAPEVMHLRGIS